MDRIVAPSEPKLISNPKNTIFCIKFRNMFSSDIIWGCGKIGRNGYVRIRQNTSEYVRIRHDTSEYVRIRQDTSGHVRLNLGDGRVSVDIRFHRGCMLILLRQTPS